MLLIEYCKETVYPDVNTVSGLLRGFGSLIRDSLSSGPPSLGGKEITIDKGWGKVHFILGSFSLNHKDELASVLGERVHVT